MDNRSKYNGYFTKNSSTKQKIPIKQSNQSDNIFHNSNNQENAISDEDSNENRSQPEESLQSVIEEDVLGHKQDNNMNDNGDEITTNCFSYNNKANNHSNHDSGLNKVTVQHLRQLESKQKLMEASMRRLLKSMKDLRCHEQASGFNNEFDKRRRIKLTRMIQILMLQRKNMQLQNDTLKKELIIVNKKFILLRKRAEVLLIENVSMRKHYSESKGDADRKSIQIESLMQNKVMMQRQITDKVDLKCEVENMKFEIRKLLIENHNMKESLKKADHLLKCKTEEKEMIELKNDQLMMDMKKMQTEETNSQFRIERLTKENDSLRQDIQKYSSNCQNLSVVSYEFEKMKEKLLEVQKNYQKLERLYVQEAEHRKELHNQLQEEKGNFRVICRVKPDSEEGLLSFKGTDKIRINDCYNLPRGDEGCYTYNRVFRPESSNRDIFEETKSLLSSCIDGYNVCFLAYGPTGSGKTYTMQGTREDPGLTLRTIAELSDLIQSIKAVWNVQTTVSMVEIYNETIYDLLHKCIGSVRLSDDGYDVRLVDVNEKQACNEQDILFWIAKGHKRRKMAATKMNLQSSRSHLIIRISLYMQNRIDNTKRSSSLIFCDLAGSESAEKIDANDAIKIETGHINRSLVALGRVFDCLKHQKTPIPYRDSKLTHLLKPCFGGQAKCLLIVTISSDPCKINRNVKALQFGQIAMDISVGKIKQNISILTTKSAVPNLRSKYDARCS